MYLMMYLLKIRRDPNREIALTAILAAILEMAAENNRVLQIGVSFLFMNRFYHVITLIICILECTLRLKHLLNDCRPFWRPF